jgi:hypothetical protein
MRDFIIQAESRGIQLSTNVGKLDVKAPKGTLTPEIVSYMKKNKTSLMRALSGEGSRSQSNLPREGATIVQSIESTAQQPALPKSVYACLDYLRRTKFEKPLTDKLETWLARDPAVTRYEAWLK